jgi:hypothetical protein
MELARGPGSFTLKSLSNWSAPQVRHVPLHQAKSRTSTNPRSLQDLELMRGNTCHDTYTMIVSDERSKQGGTNELTHQMDWELSPCLLTITVL